MVSSTQVDIGTCMDHEGDEESNNSYANCLVTFISPHRVLPGGIRRVEVVCDFFAKRGRNAENASRRGAGARDTTLLICLRLHKRQPTTPRVVGPIQYRSSSSAGFTASVPELQARGANASCARTHFTLYLPECESLYQKHLSTRATHLEEETALKFEDNMSAFRVLALSPMEIVSAPRLCLDVGLLCSIESRVRDKKKNEPHLPGFVFHGSVKLYYASSKNT